MKTKTCEICAREETIAYRIQIEKGKTWIFVCAVCCENAKTKANYKYGGTWKGSRH